MAYHQAFSNAQITDQVTKISRSSILRNSPVLCQFLRFVVDETLVGKGERIKEYTIGTMVLGRKADFDPQLDAIVRIHAGRLRRALNEFYTGEGRGDQMRISIPKGGYTPDFTTNGREERLADPDPILPERSKKPVLAVMPFRNLGHDVSNDSFCQELGEFASTELARFQELSIISYSSCLNAADGKTKDYSEMCSLLGADYILTGSLFNDHENLRVLLQLSRCDSGKQLWSNAFARKASGGKLFEIQEEIINLITGSIGGYYGAVYRDVIETSRGSGPANQEAYNIIVWYEQFIKQFDHATFDKACESLELTVKKDPSYALAWAVLSECYSIGVLMGFKRLNDQQETALNMARRAVNLDPLCQHAYQALACAYFLDRNKAGVVSTAEQCYAINPHAASFSAGVGVFLINAGEYERGAGIMKGSLKSNPYYPWASSWAFSLYHYHRQEFREAADWATKADMPQLPWMNVIKAASLAQLGKLDQAKKEIELLMVTRPDLAVLSKSYISSFILDEGLVDNVIAGLEKTGLAVRNSELTVN